jgi:hypothetical protein
LTGFDFKFLNGRELFKIIHPSNRHIFYLNCIYVQAIVYLYPLAECILSRNLDKKAINSNMLATQSSALKSARFNSLAFKPLRSTPRRSITVFASTAKVPNADLLAVAQRAADAGAAIILDAVDKPRNISYKGATDLVTDTDKASEDAILKIISEAYPDHAILGEEGGVFGNTSSGRQLRNFLKPF